MSASRRINSYLHAPGGDDLLEELAGTLGVPDYAVSTIGKVGGLRVGIPNEYVVEQMPEKIMDQGTALPKATQIYWITNQPTRPK